VTYGSLLIMTLNTQPQSQSRSTLKIANGPSVSVIQAPRSQPIPILKKKNRNDEEDEVVDTSHYYDLMTWNMYARIVTARRLRASIQARDYISRYSMDEADNQDQQPTYRKC
jgi:hypothetical protein